MEADIERADFALNDPVLYESEYSRQMLDDYLLGVEITNVYLLLGRIEGIERRVERAKRILDQIESLQGDFETLRHNVEEYEDEYSDADWARLTPEIDEQLDTLDSLRRLYTDSDPLESEPTMAAIPDDVRRVIEKAGWLNIDGDDVEFAIPMALIDVELAYNSLDE